MTDLLAVENLSKRFRGLQAVKDVSFAVPDHKIVALIGPNGAGKTTTFNLIAGALPPDTGRVRLAGIDLLGRRPDQVCAAGVARTFQLVKPFAELSVEDNVLVGALHRRHRIADARAHARAVIGLSVPEGRILLRDLLEHATQPAFVHRHEWRVGDVVMWDNRAVLHRGCRYDLAFPRDMRRTTVEDTASLHEREA